VISSGATLDLSSTTNLNGGSATTNGTLLFDGGTLNVNTNYTINGTGIFRQTGGTITGNNTFTLIAATNNDFFQFGLTWTRQLSMTLALVDSMVACARTGLFFHSRLHQRALQSFLGFFWCTPELGGDGQKYGESARRFLDGMEVAVVGGLSQFKNLR
jgi:hypothetical protein